MDTIFKNPDLVKDIRGCNTDDELQIMINKRSISCNKVTDCKLLPLIGHFNEHYLADILSFKQVVVIHGVEITANTILKNRMYSQLSKTDDTMNFQE